MIEWVVDTTASYHVMPNRELFNTYKAGDFGCVNMGNTANSNIMGIRDISIQNNVGYQSMVRRCEACSRFTPQLDVRNRLR